MKKWNIESIKNKTKGFENRSDFKKAYPYLYKLITKLGILDQVFDIPSKTSLKWDSIKKIKTHLKEMNITSLEEWREKSASTYNISRKKGWLSQVSKDMKRKKQPNNYWRKNIVDGTHFKCDSCNKILLFEQFHINKRTGLPNHKDCIECANNKRREDRKNNPSKFRKWDKKRHEQHKIVRNFGIRIKQELKNSLKKTNISTIKLVHEILGCDLSFLKNHLESKFLPGMTWENHSFNGWHIDHIRPLSSFNFLNNDSTINIQEISKAWNYKNLQPLWKYDNLKKGNKYPQEGG